MNISRPQTARSLVFLAPAGVKIQDPFYRASQNYSLHQSLTAKMQRLRGRIYLEDGAISANEITADGRQVLETDHQSWHLLTVDADGEVLGCTRYLQHGAGTQFDDLRISASPLAYSDCWGAKLRDAVEGDLRKVWITGFSYVEVGGWAMAEEVRCTSECLRSVLATYAWSRLIGGAIGISTATERNGSASILRRLGGHPVQWNGSEIPPYFDARYQCGMHMLRYDSRKPNPRYEESIENMRATLAGIAVICPERPSRQRIFQGMPAISGTQPANVPQLAA